MMYFSYCAFGSHDVRDEDDASFSTDTPAVVAFHSCNTVLVFYYVIL